MSRRTTLRAVVATVVPGAGSLDERAWCDVEAIVEKAVSERPGRQRRQLRLFLHLLEYVPVLRWARPFSRLSPAERSRCLQFFEESPILLVRRGLWGARTLAFMGYYGRPEAAREIGYTANRDGWQARGGPGP